MVSPAENNLTVRPYAQLQGGVTNYVGITQGNASAEIGGRLNCGNLRAELVAKIGTEAGARVEAGYTLPLSNKTGIDFTAGADYSKQLAQSKATDMFFEYQKSGTFSPNEQVDVPYNINHPMLLSQKYKPDMYKAYAGAGVKVAPTDKFNFTLGVEGGVRGNTLSDATVESQRYTQDLSNQNQNANFQGTLEYQTPEVMFKNRKTEAYVTPKIAAEYNINKNMAITANGSLNGAQAGFRWTF